MPNSASSAVLSILRLARPGKAAISAALVVAGFGIVSFYYKYADFGRVFQLLALMFGAFALSASASLLRKIFYRAELQLEDSGRCRSLPSGEPGGTALFFTAGLLFLAGLTAVMTVGPLAVGIGAALGLIMILLAALARRLPLFLPLLLCVEKAGLVLLGYTAYPLLPVTELPVSLGLPLVLMALFAAAVFTPMVTTAEEDERSNLVFAILAGFCVLGAAGVIFHSSWIVRGSLLAAGIALILAGAAALTASGSRPHLKFCRFARAPMLLLIIAALSGIGGLRGYSVPYRLVFIIPLAITAIFAVAASFLSRSQDEQL